FIALCAAAQLPVTRIAGNRSEKAIEMPAIKVMTGKKSVALNAAGELSPSFSVRGADAEDVVWSEDFEASASLPNDWSCDPTKNVVWSLKKPATSYNDSDNNRALFVDGDYRVYNREISSATSAQFEVPDEAMLRAFIYYSINYDNYCRLIISASDDDFENDVTELWNSKDGTGERTAHWHAVEASLAKYAGKTIRLRFTYSWGSGDESFKTGGYMGSFYIDGITVTAPGTIDSVDVITGETIGFVDTSKGDIAAWEWSFPGGTPAISTEKNPTVYYTADGSYDVSLTVTDNAGNRATTTRTGFVNVTGFAPTAGMSVADGFRYLSTLCPMVAPLAEITLSDASEGYPSAYTWEFVKYNDVTGEQVAYQTLEGAHVKKSFEYLHNWDIDLEVANQHGSSRTSTTVSAEYAGGATNLRPGDYATTFDLDGYGTFPGNNKLKITMFAEKFSKPTTPVMVEGVNVYFATASADQLADQVSNIGVHLYTSENGVPGKRIDSWWWQLTDLDPTSDLSTGTWFPFTDLPVVDDEFFIVIDGFADLYDDTDLSFYMANFRGEGNTAFMYKNDEWVDVSTYFPAGKNHTSFLVVPYVYHSVMASASGDEPLLVFDENGGSKEFALFSYLGYKSPVETGDGWCRVTNEPNGMTVDNLVIECDPLPAGVTTRETTVTPTDGHSVYTITVRQTRGSGVNVITADNDAIITVNGLEVSATGGTEVTLYTVQGVRLGSGAVVTAPSAGMYIAVADGHAVKVSLK
ncbi:MAG: PKD domain-containing protein, partial [Muribaculaceae bacterium]|nr:PKD domain-containing protein [Muribaculaceae bacterium]